ncbi:hypothetical protein TWF718_005679 [Orbilia javanica]|uniref:Uncharacterized protein n=1 Tax=Orbilia javanica TaxID=47235 RepID=A0AAN8RJK9_9PEZI
MARKSKSTTKAAGAGNTTKFGKLDYEVYCRFKRAFAGWGGTADHTASIRRVMERQRASDGDAELLAAKVGPRVVLQCLQKLLRAKAFCKSTEFKKIFPDVKWPLDPKAGAEAKEATAQTPTIAATDSTGPRAETIPNPPPKEAKPASIGGPARAPRGKTVMSRPKRENQQDRVLKPSGGGVTKPKKVAAAPRPRLPPNVPVVGNWNRGLLEPVIPESRTEATPHKEQGSDGASMAPEPKQLSAAERRQIVEQANFIAKKTFFAHIACRGNVQDIKDPLQTEIQSYKNEMAETAPGMCFDASFQIESLTTNESQIEPLALAQLISECARNLEMLGGYQLYEAMEFLKAKALAGAMHWVEEQRTELEERKRKVLEWEEAMAELLSL